MSEDSISACERPSEILSKIWRTVAGVPLMRVSSSLRPSFVVGPPGCPIERKRQTILWQVDGGGHEVIDDAKTLQVGITIAKSAIQRDQRKELFEIPEHVG